MKYVISLICGVLFGAGLAASGMTNPAKVIGFLDIFGEWDPDLLFVMGSAVVTTVVSFHFVLKRKAPVFMGEFDIPLNKVIGRKLLIGAVLFGIGWGLYGYCPGPAIASLVYLSPLTFTFVISMVSGMFMANWFLKKTV